MLIRLVTLFSCLIIVYGQVTENGDETIGMEELGSTIGMDELGATNGMDELGATTKKPSMTNTTTLDPHDPNNQGGTPADYMRSTFVVLITWEKVMCAGILVDDRWALTAAHCTVSKTGKEQDVIFYRVFAGRNPKLSDRRKQIRTVEAAFVHPNYTRGRCRYNLNDLALLKLSKPFSTPDVQVGLLSTKNFFHIFNVDEKCYMFGWNLKVLTGYPETLEEFPYAIINTSECSKTINSDLSEGDVVCVLYPGNTNPLSCSGIIGTPIMCSHVVVGILAGYGDCLEKVSMGVGSFIGDYRPWMIQIVSANSLSPAIISPSTGLILAIISLNLGKLFSD